MQEHFKLSLSRPQELPQALYDQLASLESRVAALERERLEAAPVAVSDLSDRLSPFDRFASAVASTGQWKWPISRPSTREGEEAKHGREELAEDYRKRQVQIEERVDKLQELVEQSGDHGSVCPPEVLMSGLRAVVKDVRQCLQQCDLIFQLPEIRTYVRRFQQSLQLNAMVQKKWTGPPAGPKSEDELYPEASHSMTDLRDRSGLSRGKKKEMKKQPFRTVVDWARPHTPLSLDPARPHPESSRLVLPEIKPTAEQ